MSELVDVEMQWKYAHASRGHALVWHSQCGFLSQTHLGWRFVRMLQSNWQTGSVWTGVILTRTRFRFAWPCLEVQQYVSKCLRELLRLWLWGIPCRWG